MSLQCISSLTDVDTGTEILLLDAWHVRIVWRSSLLRWFSLNSLVTLIFPKILPSDSISSDTSSSKAWSLHQVTLGVGRPDTNWNLIIETVRCGIVKYYYWMFITYNAIITSPILYINSSNGINDFCHNLVILQATWYVVLPLSVSYQLKFFTTTNSLWLCPTKHKICVVLLTRSTLRLPFMVK